MILLEKEKYNILIDPLKKVPINISFAHSVIDKDITGKVYVDNKENPKTFYIIHPYGLSLLLGNCVNTEFNNTFREYALNTSKERDTHEWMQAYPEDWDIVLNRLFENNSIKSKDNSSNKETGIIEINTRVNFKFNLTKYIDLKKKNVKNSSNIVKADRQIFNEMKGNVIPLNFWDNAEDFYDKGISFGLFYDGKLASTAFSACIQNGKIEIGIETLPEFQGKGFAIQTCSRMIDYCLENNYEPVWSCRLENTGSYKLAQKLGFEPTIELPFYRLSK